jgi:serine/threonine-protein phosphatase 2A regulatory subunit B'
MLGDQKSVVSNIIPNLEIVMEMIERNIFRPLPNIKKSTSIGMSETGIEQEEKVDPSWPHLQGIYEFFLQLILNDAADVKSMKVYITPQFIQGVSIIGLAVSSFWSCLTLKKTTRETI